MSGFKQKFKDNLIAIDNLIIPQGKQTKNFISYPEKENLKGKKYMSFKLTQQISSHVAGREYLEKEQGSPQCREEKPEVLKKACTLRKEKERRRNVQKSQSTYQLHDWSGNLLHEWSEFSGGKYSILLKAQLFFLSRILRQTLVLVGGLLDKYTTWL